MKHMSRSYKKEDAMLRPEHESTLEKQQKERMKPKPQELAVGGKGDILNRKTNERMKRKVALLAAMNKIHDADIA
jgi:hypothetical protein